VTITCIYFFRRINFINKLWILDEKQTTITTTTTTTKLENGESGNELSRGHGEEKPGVLRTSRAFGCSQESFTQR
jgi:hypothetical protein